MRTTQNLSLKHCRQFKDSIDGRTREMIVVHTLKNRWLIYWIIFPKIFFKNGCVFVFLLSISGRN